MHSIHEACMVVQKLFRNRSRAHMPQPARHGALNGAFSELKNLFLAEIELSPTYGLMEECSSSISNRESLHGIAAKPAVRRSHRNCLSTLIVPRCVQDRGTSGAKQNKPQIQVNLSVSQQENTADGLGRDSCIKERLKKNDSNNWEAHHRL